MYSIKQMFTTNYSTVEQLGLYQMFHQNHVNKFIHCLALPFIVYSGFLPLVQLEIGAYSTFTFDLGQLFLVFSLLFYAFLDRRTTLAVACWTIPLLYAAQYTAVHCSGYEMTVIFMICQLLGWYLAVQLGHEQIESTIVYKGEAVSSNVYFEQKLFVLQNLGKAPTWIDTWLQFAVGPFHSTLEILFEFGYHPALQQAIEQQMKQNLRQFAKGELLYDYSFHTFKP